MARPCPPPGPGRAEGGRAGINFRAEPFSIRIPHAAPHGCAGHLGVHLHADHTFEALREGERERPAAAPEVSHGEVARIQAEEAAENTDFYVKSLGSLRGVKSMRAGSHGWWKNFFTTWTILVSFTP